MESRLDWKVPFCVGANEGGNEIAVLITSAVGNGREFVRADLMSVDSTGAWVTIAVVNGGSAVMVTFPPNVIAEDGSVPVLNVIFAFNALSVLLGASAVMPFVP
jgi:hypothetical protein